MEGDSPPRPKIQPGPSGSKSTWSLTPLVEGSSSTSQSGPNKQEEKEENKKKGKRRIAGPTMFGIDQEISLAAHGKMDVDKGGKEKPWRKLRIKPKFNREEEERKRDFIEKVAVTLKEKLKDGTLVANNDDSTAAQEVKYPSRQPSFTSFSPEGLLRRRSSVRTSPARQQEGSCQAAGN